MISRSRHLDRQDNGGTTRLGDADLRVALARVIVALMKQERAFGVGVVLSRQNPSGLDYRALGNAGLA